MPSTMRKKNVFLRKTYEEEKVTLDAQISEIEEKKSDGRSTSDIADRDHEMYGRAWKKAKAN